ncbi:MAG: TIGR00341 family protein [Ignavibacteriae bacterium]|nr:TIGR00341 family protein [Ignavibacteriota bacterium]
MQIDPNEKEVYIERNFFSQDVPVEERTNVFNKLFFHYKKDWQGSFGLMLFLSVGIACLGLSEDSTAVIIGAMIIAPLGQPIIALGGTISLGWGKQSFRMLKIIFIGTISTLAVSFIFGFILPNDTPNQQILIRTSPDLRDMGIAILAGAAGAYGYFRSEFSTILSGVAIAVALVPPLCTCGLMLEQGHFILAGGSFLLFITNFIGITFSALLLFFLLGIRHKRNLKWFYTGTVTVILLGTSVIFPLALNYKNFSSDAQFQSSVYEKAGNVFAHSKNSTAIKDLSIQGTGVIITIDPFPVDKNEEKRLITEIEQTTGLQVFLKGSSK